MNNTVFPFLHIGQFKQADRPRMSGNKKIKLQSIIFYVTVGQTGSKLQGQALLSGGSAALLSLYDRLDILKRFGSNERLFTSKASSLS